MYRSYRSSASSRVFRNLALVAFPAAIAVVAPLNTNAVAAVGVPAVAGGGGPTVQDSLPPDQKFLRETSRGHAGMALIAHETLKLPGTSPAKAEAKKVDQRVDDEMDRMRAALKSIYNDSYVAKPRQTALALADSLGKLTGATYDDTYMKWVMEYDRLLILSIDRATPTLTNADVKGLAQKMRASASADMTNLKTKLGVQKPVPVPS
jgi:hypothetical protein